MGALKPVCVPCRRFYRPKKNDYRFIEGMPGPDFDSAGKRLPRALPGTAQPERWRPYKIWSADLWECEGCHNQILSGFGQGPLAEHYQDGFEERVKRYGADQLQVNDC